MKLFIALTLLFPIMASAQRAPDLPPGYCYVGCRGERPVRPYDFVTAARRFGDPNSGGRLGSTVRVPSREGGPSDTPVATSSFLDELMLAENFAAGSCGVSLNDDRRGDIIDVVAPCGDIEKIMEANAHDARSQFRRSGNQPMSDQVAKQAYDIAMSQNQQTRLKDRLYCSFVPGGRGSNQIDNQHCEPFDLLLGAERTLAAGMKSKICRRVSVPRFVPESRQVVGSGTIECRRGLPPRAATHTNGDVNFGIWIFNNQLTLLGMDSRQRGSLDQASTHFSRTVVRGNNVCQIDRSGDRISVDETCPVARQERRIGATFMVGPIPISVEAGAMGEVGTADFAKVGPLWANSRLGPYVDTAGFAAAYINLLIIRGGVEASLTFFNDRYFLSGLSAVAHVPQSPTTPREGFYFSEQLNGVNQINALSGRIDAFVQVPVPKFIGFRWKKFRLNIFQWGGFRATGYVIDRREGPVELMQLML
jgi:hypothetical protein